MKIDVTKAPPAAIFQYRGVFKIIVIICLMISCGGMLLAAYAIFSDLAHSERLETVAFALFVGPVLIFSYFGEKLQAFKKLTKEQETELADFIRNYPVIRTYCELVAKDGRNLTLGEYEAAEAWVEDVKRQR